MHRIIHNRVLLMLSVLLILAAFSLPFLNYAPNRLVSGQPLPLYQLLTGAEWLLLLPLASLVLQAFLPIGRWNLALVVVLSELLFIALIALSGHQATLLSQQGSPLARTSWAAASGSAGDFACCWRRTPVPASALSRSGDCCSTRKSGYRSSFYY